MTVFRSPLPSLNTGPCLTPVPRYTGFVGYYLSLGFLNMVLLLFMQITQVLSTLRLIPSSMNAQNISRFICHFIREAFETHAISLPHVPSNLQVQISSLKLWHVNGIIF
ncbi:hypothetical protein F511_26055 [Dorcoceras hygrometricum]|uniref:Uncharacterized protein n=1 Tax=Dorcoceras hygrometricum TaxID=472368 RepID=A0A2Z7CV18_9LAMI|nr:hypothetical protein F511_26055 [Dorcoceras hygrometricum]